MAGAALRCRGLAEGDPKPLCAALDAYAEGPRLGWESLTGTERRVVDLVAEGLTNPQIGERLFVSRRTVQTHLAHVFAKLDISSRAQLAAEVARRRQG